MLNVGRGRYYTLDILFLHVVALLNFLQMLGRLFMYY